MTDPSWELREACWAIVKDSRGMNETGHAAAVRWARAVLGLDESRDEPYEAAAPREIVSTAPITYRPWPDGINPYVTPERRAELLSLRRANVLETDPDHSADSRANDSPAPPPTRWRSSW